MDGACVNRMNMMIISKSRGETNCFFHRKRPYIKAKIEACEISNTNIFTSFFHLILTFSNTYKTKPAIIHNKPK